MLLEIYGKENPKTHNPKTTNIQGEKQPQPYESEPLHGQRVKVSNVEAIRKPSKPVNTSRNQTM